MPPRMRTRQATLTDVKLQYLRVRATTLDYHLLRLVALELGAEKRVIQSQVLWLLPRLLDDSRETNPPRSFREN